MPNSAATTPSTETLPGWGSVETKQTSADSQGRNVVVTMRYLRPIGEIQPIHSAKVHLRARRDAFVIQGCYPQPDGKDEQLTVLLTDDIFVRVESVYEDIPGLPPGASKKMAGYTGVVPKYCMCNYKTVNGSAIPSTATKMLIEFEFVAASTEPTFRVRSMVAS